MIVALRYDGSAVVWGLFASMVCVRFSVWWYLPAIALIPGVVGSAQLIARAAGETIPESEAFLNLISIPIAIVWIFFLGGPLQQEAGWRCAATQAFQPRIGASLITDVFWGLMASTVLLSVLLTWVQNNKRGSLFAAMLMHRSWKWAIFLFTASQADTGGLAFLLLLTGLATLIGKMSFRAIALRPQSPSCRWTQGKSRTNNQLGPLKWRRSGPSSSRTDPQRLHRPNSADRDTSWQDGPPGRLCGTRTPRRISGYAGASQKPSHAKRWQGAARVASFHLVEWKFRF